MPWKYFHGNGNENHSEDNSQELKFPPECPPWREFISRKDLEGDSEKRKKDDEYWHQLHELARNDDRSSQRGKSFRVVRDKDGYSEIVDAVNAAIHLRRPLLVTGVPGSGKTTLAYAIAHELQLGPVLSWPITARSNLLDAEYRYDAIARLQDAQLDKTREVQGNVNVNDATRTQSDPKEEGSLGDYIHLGPVGTAFLPSLRPRVLLIDEIDKSDLNLPNDLLNLFEEGEFEIRELVRRKRYRSDMDAAVTVRTADKDMEAQIVNGRVKCCEFPIVIMTSNGERDFPAAFYRRCLRVRMPNPTKTSLLPIVRSHFDQADPSGWSKTEQNLTDVIDDFLGKDNKADRATDQLLNAIYLMTRDERPTEAEMKQLQKLLFKRLHEDDG